MKQYIQCFILTTVLSINSVWLGGCTPMELVSSPKRTPPEKIVTGAEFDITPNPQAKQAYKLNTIKQSGLIISKYFITLRSSVSAKKI